MNNIKKTIAIFLIAVIVISGIIITVLYIKDKNQKNELSEYFADKEELTAKEDIYTAQETIDAEIKGYQKDSSYTLKKAKVMLNPYKISPLSALIIFKTKKSVTVTVNINGIDVTTTESSKKHSIPIYGLYEGYDNVVKLTTSDGEVATYTVTTEKSTVAQLTVNNASTKLNDDLYFMTSPLGNPITAYDKEGKLRWYLTENFYNDIEFLDNGHLLLANGELGTSYGVVSGLVEVDYLGKIYNQYILKSGYHHEVNELKNGNLLVAGSNYDTDRIYDYITEIDRKTGKEVKTIDLYKIVENIDTDLASTFEYNWAWNNSVYLDEETNLLVVSLRDMNSVMAIDYKTSEIKWIFGDSKYWSSKFDKYFLKVTDNSRYPLGQHSAFITEDGLLGIFNNGYDAYKAGEVHCSELINNYSSLVLYKIDGMNISTSWEYGKDKDYFSYALSNFQILDNGNKLANFGWEFTEESYHEDGCVQLGNMNIYANIVELGTDDEILFDATIKQGKYRVFKNTLYSDKTNDFEVVSYTKYDNNVSSDYEIVKVSKLLDSLKQSSDLDVSIELTSTKLILSALFTPEDEVKVMLIGEKGDNYLYTYKETNEETIPVLYLNRLKGKYLIYLIINGEYVDTNKVAVFK
ncbi:MAG: aryl-sulfate sulfotransferase [Bacilli bacterium]|nr:aryl-sulfate sulfotransferase [Bacilli bacterium]